MVINIFETNITGVNVSYWLLYAVVLQTQGLCVAHHVLPELEAVMTL